MPLAQLARLENLRLENSTLLIMPLIGSLILSAFPTIACPALKRDVDAIVNQPQFRRAQFGILIQTQGTNPTDASISQSKLQSKLQSKPLTLYAHNPDQLLLPASNAKLLTTAVALRSLPLDFTVNTSIYDLGKGEFYLLGQGDPALQDQHLQAFAQSLVDRKVNTIKKLIINDRYYGDDWINPFWEWEDLQADYAPPVNGLILNENAIGLTLTPDKIGKPLMIKWNEVESDKAYRVENLTQTVAIDQPEFINIIQPEPGLVRITGQLRMGAEAESMGIAVQQPRQYFRDRLQTILRSKGITLESIEFGKRPLKNASIVASHASPNLSDWVDETNQNSNNLYAETLLRQLGRSDTKVTSQFSQFSQSIEENFTSDRGLTVVRQELTAMGVDPNSYQLVDGSGLARRNWVSPEAIVQVLQVMQNNQTFRRSLPIAGKSGSLIRRFKNTDAEGILSAKTGFLTGAIGLSGYVTPKGFSPIVFSLLLNHATVPLDEQLKAIDAIALRLAKLNRCELSMLH